MRKLASLLLLVAAAALQPAAHAGDLVIYTSLETDQLPQYEAAIKADIPNLNIKWIRESTGVITKRLLEGGESQKADAILGLAATSLVMLDQAGLLMPYAANGIKDLDKRFVSSAKVPTWTGMGAWESAICVNTEKLKEKGVAAPRTWKDLTNPAYKGMIIMPNPISSGTGFMAVSAWLQMQGEREGWNYLDKLHNNIESYVHSGSKPCKMVAKGEIPIGISFGYRAAMLKEKTPALDIVFPKEGLGWDVEAAAITTSSRNVADAKKLMDWAASEKANRLYAEFAAVVARKGFAKPLEHRPSWVDDTLIKNDFGWAAKNYDRVLAEWARRYDAKTKVEFNF